MSDSKAKPKAKGMTSTDARMLKLGRGPKAAPKVKGAKQEPKDEVVRDALAMVLDPEAPGFPSTIDVASWHPKHRALALKWAQAAHLRASDNPVAVPAAPQVLLTHYERAGAPFPAPKEAKPAPKAERDYSQPFGLWDYLLKHQEG